MKKEKKFTKLNTHQWALYRFLENIMLNENNRTTTIKEIVEHFPDEYELKITEGNHSNCPNLYADLKAITMTNEVDMVVCLNHNNIRLGTELDVLKRLWSLISRSREEEKRFVLLRPKLEIMANSNFSLIVECQLIKLLLIRKHGTLHSLIRILH